jgi:acyl carrier protein
VLLASSDGLAAAVPEAGPAKRTTTPGAAAASPLGGAGDDIEDRLRVTVAAALRLAPEEVEPDTSFAEYGADSIISVELVRCVNEAFGIDLKTTALFNYATVRELAGYIRLEHGTAAAAAAAPVGAELTDRITGSKERSDRLRRLIRRRLESGVPLPAVAEEPTPRPAEAAPVRQDAPPPRPAGDEDGLGSVLRRLAAGEICYADAMTIPLTDA